MYFVLWPYYSSDKLHLRHIKILNLYNEFYILFQIWSFRKGENVMLSLQCKVMFYNQMEFVFTLNAHSLKKKLDDYYWMLSVYILNANLLSFDFFCARKTKRTAKRNNYKNMSWPQWKLFVFITSRAA